MNADPPFAPSDDEVSGNRVWKVLEDNSFRWLLPLISLRAESPMYTMRNRWRDMILPLSNSCPLLRDMHYPLGTYDNTSWPGALPPNYFFGTYRKGEHDVYDEFGKLVDAWDTLMGPHRRSDSSNALTAIWSSWPAQVRLMAFPLDRNPHLTRPSSWGGDPETINCIQIDLHTGISWSLSDAEKRLVESSIELDLPPLPPEPPLSIQAQDTRSEVSHISPIENFRRLDRSYKQASDLRTSERSLRLCRSKSHLIDVRSDCACIFPVDQIESLEVSRLTPAKGTGGSFLRLNLRSLDASNKAAGYSITRSSNPDGLTDYAEKLGEILHMKTRILAYEPDC
jgi:hypothetical protein